MTRRVQTDRCRGEGPGHEARALRHPLRARDVMVSNPTTLPADASVHDARAALADDHVHMILLTEAGKLRGTLVRTDLVPATGDETPALPWTVLADRTVHPETPVEAVHQLLRNGMRRLAVIAEDHTLLGLVCLKRSRSGFCSDADVAARSTATAASKNGEAR